MEAAAGWVHFWLGGNASLTTRHLVFIRILLLLLLPCCCYIECDCPSVCMFIRNSSTHSPTLGKSALLLPTFLPLPLLLGSYLCPEFITFLATLPPSFPPPVSLLYACLYMCWLAYFPGGDKAV